MVFAYANGCLVSSHGFLGVGLFVFGPPVASSDSWRLGAP